MSIIDRHLRLHQHRMAGAEAEELLPQSKNSQLADSYASTHHVKADSKRPITVVVYTAHLTGSVPHGDASQRSQNLHSEPAAVSLPSSVHSEAAQRNHELHSETAVKLLPSSVHSTCQEIVLQSKLEPLRTLANLAQQRSRVASAQATFAMDKRFASCVVARRFTSQSR